jgi:CRP-like cAMP-binding protein
MADFDFPAGKIIFKQGDPSDRAYLIFFNERGEE